MDYYRVLHLHPGAPPEVVEAACQALIARHAGDPGAQDLIREAHRVLSDPGRRGEYDRARGKSGGRVLGEYRVLRKIAEGGCGTTYHAEHRVLQTPVCVKHALNVGPGDEALLLDEARAIWDLRHWGIPAMRDLLRLPDGSLALVMSFVPGPTLAQLIEKYPDGLDPEHVAWITERILNILKYLHLHGVVHGDLKPQNVIIQTETHTVTLVDYGLSSIRPTRGTQAKGFTPHFAAPEQVDGGVLLPETDLFGLGMSMIFALGGDVARIRVPETTPPAICGFIKRLIRRDPLRRPRVWTEEDLCETIREVREQDFGRTASGMKPLHI